MTKAERVPTPKKDRLVVRPEEQRSVSDGGIIIPDQAKDAPTQGEIVKVGPEVTDLEVGETALYSMYAGTEVQVEGVLYKVMRESDVYATV